MHVLAEDPKGKRDRSQERMAEAQDPVKQVSWMNIE